MHRHFGLTPHFRLDPFFDENGQNKNRWNVWISAIFLIWCFNIVVPLGLEPRTPWLWVRCSNQLSYRTLTCSLDKLTKRSDRDSNSGNAFDVYTLSRRASSATRASLPALRVQSYEFFLICKLFITFFSNFFWYSHSALSFKIVLLFGKCCYFIADIWAFFVLRFYGLPPTGLIFEKETMVA